MKRNLTINELLDWCYWYVENSTKDVNDKIVYQNEKMHAKCVEYIYTPPAKRSDKLISTLLNHFNNL